MIAESGDRIIPQIAVHSQSRQLYNLTDLAFSPTASPEVSHLIVIFWEIWCL